MYNFIFHIVKQGDHIKKKKKDTIQGEIIIRDKTFAVNMIPTF